MSVRSRILAVVLMFVSCVSMALAAGQQITVMTKNMDSGTDLAFVLQTFGTADQALGVQATWLEAISSDPARRAALLAQEIAETKPDIVSLQEVTLWSSGSTTFDQLQLLLDALRAAGQSYALVVQNPLTDITLPMPDETLVRYLDRDAVIARTDLGIANVATGVYTNLATLAGVLTVKRGWITCDATVGGKTLRFAGTHLESTYPGVPEVNLLQAAQAGELATLLAGSPYPVVVGGDFNSNALHTPPEHTPSVGVMLTAGYTDSWTAAHRGIPGYTWPLYVEDPLRANPNGPFERIDFVFERGLTVVSADRTGMKKPHSSDHAGVLVTLEF